jgi:HNH endonuclease
MEIKERLLSKAVKDIETGCIIWIGHCSHLGYGAFRIGSKVWKAHRASWELLRGPIPDGLDVLHKCDVRSCINPDHLFIGTHQDNMRDMVSKKRFPYRHGEKHINAAFTGSQVSYIRARYSPGRGAELAREFGVSRSTIHGVVTGKTYKERAA